MPSRCGCASDRCSCRVVEGRNVSVTGSGSDANPYVVSAATTVVDTEGNQGAGDGRLVGEIIEYGGVNAPVGWLLCNGAAVSRAVYSDLFAIIGTVYGAGDGSTTFNVPDKSNRVTLGASGSHPRGEKGGSATHTLTTGEMPQHHHAMDHNHPSVNTAGNHDHPLQRSTAVGSSNSTIPKGTTNIADTGTGAIMFDGSHSHSVPAYTGDTGNTGSGTPVDMLPPYVASNYLIKT